MSTILDPETVAAEALTWPDRARAVVITDTPSYLAAAELLRGIKALRGKVADTFTPLRQKAHAAWKAVCAAQDAADAPLTEAEGVIKLALRDWDTAQERVRQAEAARLAELARQAEADRRLAEAAALEREATASGDDGLRAEAEALIAAPVETPVVQVAKATPTVAGISYREVWKFEIVDANALPREYLLPDMTRIGGVVRAMKDATRIPGIRVYAEKTLAASGASR